MMDNTIPYLSVDHFQMLGRSLKLQDCIFLDDNLESGGTLKVYDDVSKDRIAGRFPYKLNFWAAIIAVSGEMRSLINGQEYRLRDGDAMIVPSGAIVEYLTCSPDIKDIVMAFADNDEILYSQKSTSVISAWLKHQTAPFKFHLDESRLDSYLTMYKEVKKLYKTADPRYKDDIVKGLLQISTASFTSDMMAVEPGGRPSDRNRAEELYFAFINDLQKFCTVQREVSFYAEKRCVCSKYFTRQVKAASGKTPAQIIKERVIIEAKAMLNSSDASVKGISEALNFPNTAFFCRYFKQETGMTPSEFRKS